MECETDGGCCPAAGGGGGRRVVTYDGDDFQEMEVFDFGVSRGVPVCVLSVMLLSCVSV